MSLLLDVGVLGATGMVGERLVRMLHGHPWFGLREVGASERSVGASLASRIADPDQGPLPVELSNLTIRSLSGGWSSPLLLSALPSGVAGELEVELASAGHLVVSNASSHRMRDDVPLVVPEVNPDHLELLSGQRTSWPGGLVTNPNCVVTGVALALAPLHREFGLEAASITTFQAISGAGRPGPPAHAVMDNILPHIEGEEEKLGNELRKILGTLDEGRVRPADIRVSSTCTRVPVLHGHLASISVAFARTVGPDVVEEAVRAFRSPIAHEGLPLAPQRPLLLLDQPDRPQPRLDRDRSRGMAVSVGRVRDCEVLDVKLLVLSHNLIRGAAGAALLNAELCKARGVLQDKGAAQLEPAGGG